MKRWIVSLVMSAAMGTTLASAQSLEHQPRSNQRRHLDPVRPSQTEHVYRDRHWPVQRVESRGDRRFFHGSELRQHGDHPRNDWHFGIGNHDRGWYYSRYSNIVVIDGCWYYEDAGYFWPAYGFDPGCQYANPTLVFQIN